MSFCLNIFQTEPGQLARLTSFGSWQMGSNVCLVFRRKPVRWDKLLTCNIKDNTSRMLQFLDDVTIRHVSL